MQRVQVPSVFEYRDLFKLLITECNQSWRPHLDFGSMYIVECMAKVHVQCTLGRHYHALTLFIPLSQALGWSRWPLVCQS
jgi:hypothetical protein